jgi:hypothetical protein
LEFQSGTPLTQSPGRRTARRGLDCQRPVIAETSRRRSFQSPCKDKKTAGMASTFPVFFLSFSAFFLSARRFRGCRHCQWLAQRDQRVIQRLIEMRFCVVFVVFRGCRFFMALFTEWTSLILTPLSTRRNSVRVRAREIWSTRTYPLNLPALPVRKILRTHIGFSTKRIVTDRRWQSIGIRNRTWVLPDEKFAWAPHPQRAGGPACPGRTPCGSSEIEHGSACLPGTGLKDDQGTL